MKASFGKVRFGIVALMAVAAFAMVTIVGFHRSAGRAYGTSPGPTLLVANACSSSVSAYDTSSSGDIAPLSPAPSGLGQPRFVAFDKNGNFYVSNECNATVTIYAKGSTGAPLAVIGGSNTGLTEPEGIAVDPASGTIYVVEGTDALFVFPPLGSSTGLLNEAPTATIEGGLTTLVGPLGVALDSNRNIYVTANSNGVLIFPAVGSATGTINEAPIASIVGSNTLVGVPAGVTLDPSNNIYVSSNVGISIFPPLGASTGPLNETPTAAIEGTMTGESSPLVVALDSGLNIYLTNAGSSLSAPNVTVYPPLGGSTGTLNEKPTATIGGSNTGLAMPYGIALDSSNKVYVTDKTSSLFVFPAVGSSTGTLNEAPSAALGEAVTGLADPRGIGVDSSGKIYVTNLSSVLKYVSVYPAGSNATVAPIAIIGGTNTTLNVPEGVAVDPSGNIYVADSRAAVVFIFPPLGSSTGTLNEAATAFIGGGNTGVTTPFGVALDSSLNVYVADSTAGVLIFPPVGNSTGLINNPPTASISGSNTGLGHALGIALDSSDNIYVTADNSAASVGSVFVYQALGGSTGPLNEDPLFTISGSNSGLNGPDLGVPQGLALDSGNNVYVPEFLSTKFGQSVLIFPPVATSGGLPNEAPSGEFAGPATALTNPQGVAILSPASTTPTPTATTTRTATATPTATATATSSHTATATATRTATATASATGSRTATATATATRTATPTASATGSSTATPTATASATRTATATASATGSSGATPTATATATRTATATPTATETPVGTVSISPSSLNFGDKTAVGKPSKAKHVTIKNSGNKKTGAAVSVTMESAAPSVFTVKSQCDKTLGPGKKCKISVIFTPVDDTTAETGSLKIFDSATGSPQSVGLSGIGKAPKKKK